MNARRKAEAFRALHESGCFVLPNPWDRGSAGFLATLGFKALATTSAGLAFSLGRPDSPLALTRELALENIRAIVEATDLPVTADFQAGYGETPDEVAESVALCVQTGVAGLSIEDATGAEDQVLYDRDVAVERVRAARSAIAASGCDVVLTARAECYLVGHSDPLRESIERLAAFADAGADCLYAPGLRSAEQIAQVVGAVTPKPVNVLITDPTNMSVSALAALGVRRISIGSALARVAWTAFMAAAREIATTGSFSALASAAPFATFAELFDGA